jgi:hypothetical protein
MRNLDSRHGLGTQSKTEDRTPGETTDEQAAVRDVRGQLISSGKESNLAQVMMISEEELATRRMSALILFFTAGSLLLFPLLALLQISVVDRIRIRAG